MVEDDIECIDPCWEQAYELLESGDVNGAVNFCTRDICINSSVGCQRFLGWECYEKGDLGLAFEYFEKSAATGDSESMYGLACIYIGYKDYPAALEHLLEAYERGYMRSTYWIGVIVEHGLTGERNIELAREYYAKGAESGYLIAERALLHLTFAHGSFFQKLSKVPVFLSLITRSLFIAAKNKKDERLADVPNAFKK